MTKQLTEQQAEALKKAEWACREYRGLPEGADYHNIYRFAKELAQHFDGEPFSGKQVRYFCNQLYQQGHEFCHYLNSAPRDLYEKGILARTPHPTQQHRFYYAFSPEALVDLEQLAIPQVRQTGTRKIRQRPEMDELIERGETLEAIGRAGKITYQGARRYIGVTRQYDKWIMAKEKKRK